MLTINPACRRRGLLIVCGLVIGVLVVSASGQANGTPAPAVTTADIVRQLVDHNQDRANRLRYYTSQRHYHLEYHGFPHSADAAMDVEAVYSAPSKNFRVLSESGSPKLINHVLKKLLKGEQDAPGEQCKKIRHLYTKVGEFWLPKQNTTVTKVRLGGTATLSIDFEKYDFESAATQILQLSEATAGSQSLSHNCLGISSH